MKLIQILVFIIFILLSVGCARQKDREVPLENFDFEKNKDINFDLINIEEKFYLPIIAIHHVGDPSVEISPENKLWYISEKKFTDLLEIIKENDYRPIFMEEAIDYIHQGLLPNKSIILTFDDGANDFYTKAWPILKKCNFKANVYIMTGVKSVNWLNREQIKDLYKSGLVDFGSHTRYHTYLTRVSLEEADEEMRKSKFFLEELLEKPIRIISYPFGLYDGQIIELAKSLGYEAGLTIKSGVWQEKQKLFEFKRNIITNNSDITNLFLEE